MVSAQGSRPAVPSGTTPTVADGRGRGRGGGVVGGGLYEAGFSTTGVHPQCGVTLARTVEEARNRLADLLLLCDPGAPAVADITECTRAQMVARYSGTVGEVFAQLIAGAQEIQPGTGRVRDGALLQALQAEGGVR